VSLLLGFNHVAVGNERSANFGNGVFVGNHEVTPGVFVGHHEGIPGVRLREAGLCFLSAHLVLKYLFHIFFAVVQPTTHR
jgi:hypothetical protein